MFGGQWASEEPRGSAGRLSGTAALTSRPASMRSQPQANQQQQQQQQQEEGDEGNEQGKKRQKTQLEGKGRKVGAAAALDGSAKGLIDTNPPRGGFPPGSPGLRPRIQAGSFKCLIILRLAEAGWPFGMRPGGGLCPGGGGCFLPSQRCPAQTPQTPDPAGTRDFAPDEMRLRNWLFGHWAAVAQRCARPPSNAARLPGPRGRPQRPGDRPRH
jgi:hypothetical protein